jgi:hypothetical protein
MQPFSGQESAFQQHKPNLCCRSSTSENTTKFAGRDAGGANSLVNGLLQLVAATARLFEFP